MDHNDLLELASWTRAKTAFCYSFFLFWNFCGFVTAFSVIAGTWLTQALLRNNSEQSGRQENTGTPRSSSLPAAGAAECGILRGRLACPPCRGNQLKLNVFNDRNGLDNYRDLDNDSNQNPKPPQGFFLSFRTKPTETRLKIL